MTVADVPFLEILLRQSRILMNVLVMFLFLQIYYIELFLLLLVDVLVAYWEVHPLFQHVRTVVTQTRSSCIRHSLHLFL